MPKDGIVSFGQTADDIDSETYFNGVTFMLVGHCDDPTPEEKSHIYDALDMRGSLDLTQCDSNDENESCRTEFKRVLSSHRNQDNGGWSARTVQKAAILTDHGIDFSTPEYDSDKNSSLVDDDDEDGIGTTSLYITSSMLKR